MYLGSWKIDDYLTFVCNTHKASDGAATDADAVPTYRVYEDETGTAILTGSMAKLDDANTVGFYGERIQLTAASGHEKGKSYSIYISATVSSVTGTMSHTYQIEAEVDANTVSATNVSANMIQAGGSTIQQSGGYLRVKDDEGNTLANESKQDTIDGTVNAIKSKTDALPSDPADDSEVKDTIKAHTAQMG